MNKIYIDQITRYMNMARFQFKNYYDDQAMATGALQWFIDKIEEELNKCHGAKDGKCEFYWKHDECLRLMNILHDLTGDEKYNINAKKTNFWD